MRLGIIDLGTNSVRFDVHALGQNGVVRLLHREKLMIRLGEGVFIEGKLKREAIHRTLQAFLSFKRTATTLHTEKVLAFATSALRDASDASTFVELIKKKTGIDIRVISGEEEAQLIAMGILANEAPLKGRFGLVDIGGGSTEITICRGTEILFSASFQLGVARIQQLFLKTTPPASDAVQSLRRYIKSVLVSKVISEGWPQVEEFIGSSGTIRSLDRILRKVNGATGINSRNLKKLSKHMSTMTRKDLLQIPGMETKRVGMILAGAMLFSECMEALGADHFVTTNYSLRDGILDREIRQLTHQKGPEVQFQLKDLFDKAVRLGSNPSHLKKATYLSEKLFEGTKSIHRLKPEWKRYLTAAALLYKTGEGISPIHQERHACYIVRNAEFVTMENWEHEFIALLCLFHNSAKVTKKDLQFIKDKSRRRAFTYLLGLLQMVDALTDPASPGEAVEIKSIRVERTRIRLGIETKRSADLKVLKVEQRKPLLEKIFRRQILIRHEGKIVTN